MIPTSSSQRSAAVDPPEQPLAFLWRGRWTILIMTMLGAVLGVLYAQQRGTVWRATSVLFVERGGPVALGQDASWGQQLPRNYAAAQAALLRSTPVLVAALEQPGVAHSPLFEGKHNELAWLKRNLEVGVGDQDDLITVTLDSSLPREACDAVNAIVDAYRQLRSDANPRAAVLDKLTSELDRYEQTVREEQAALLAFHEQNPDIQLHEDLNTVASERFQQLHAALTQAELAALEAGAASRAAAELVDTPDLLLQVPILGPDGIRIHSPSDSAEARQLRDLRGLLLRLQTEMTADSSTRQRELQALRLKLLAQVTPEHPAIVELDKTLELFDERDGDAPAAELEQAINELQELSGSREARFADAYVTALQRRHESALQWRDDLRAEAAAQEAVMLAVDPKQAEYRALEMRAERARRIADLLYERVSELDIMAAVGDASPTQSDALVFEYASPESAIVSSSKRAIAALATFLGMLLGAALAWLRSLGDEKLRSIDDVATLVPVLTTLPRIDVSPAGAVATWKKDPEFSEAMRSLRVAMTVAHPDGGCRTIQVASPADGDGKSLVAAGLAMAMARSGLRTLLIDADFRRPQQARLFAAKETQGLAGMLQGGRLEKLAVHTEVDGLDLLPSGMLEVDHTELLSGPRLGTTLRAMEASYDSIVIDSPPLLRISDGRIIAAASDETLLVVRSGKTTRRLASAATGSVTSVGGHIAGCVLNGVHRASMLGTSVRAYGSLVRDAADDD